MTDPGAPSGGEPQRAALIPRAARALRRFLTEPPYRHQLWWRLAPKADVYQHDNVTVPDRYPRIFRFVQRELGADSALRILSYGCSTGEEVFSLRHYFPSAVIKGIDINPGNIAVCRRRLVENPDRAIAFETASSTREEPSAAYDAIFCMAVLRHGDLRLPGVTRCDHRIRFDDFARSVEDFARCLKPGGLLSIRYSNFRLCDAPAGANFEAVLSVKYRVPPRYVRIFGPDNRLREGVTYPDAVFRKKTGDASGAGTSASRSPA